MIKKKDLDTFERTQLLKESMDCEWAFNPSTQEVKTAQLDLHSVFWAIQN